MENNSPRVPKVDNNICKTRFVRYMKKIFDNFRGPDEETVASILSRVGIKESDESYEKLKIGLGKLIGRRIKEKDSVEFFKELSGQVYKKFKREIDRGIKESKEEARNEAFQALREDLSKSKEQITTEVMLKALSPRILAIIDHSVYEILKLLREVEENSEFLKRTLNLKDSELIWRISYLRDLGFLKIRYSDDEFYSLTDMGVIILEKRRAEFEELINLLGDKVHKLSLKTVGGDNVMAGRLVNWLKSSRGGRHMGIIEKLSKEYGGDPRRISQAFFGMREMGVAHEKHIGVKISDHQAAGELLLFELQKLHSSASRLSTYQTYPRLKATSINGGR